MWKSLYKLLWHALFFFSQNDMSWPLEILKNHQNIPALLRIKYHEPKQFVMLWSYFSFLTVTWNTFKSRSGLYGTWLRHAATYFSWWNYGMLNKFQFEFSRYIYPANFQELKSPRVHLNFSSLECKVMIGPINMAQYNPYIACGFY